jgi:hypothetical protein
LLGLQQTPKNEPLPGVVVAVVADDVQQASKVVPTLPLEKAQALLPYPCLGVQLPWLPHRCCGGGAQPRAGRGQRSGTAGR